MAFALIGLALGQTGARLDAASSMPSSHRIEHAAGHGHEHPTPGQHDHSDRPCVTACCIAVSNWTPATVLGERVFFASSVLYGEPAQPDSGRSDAPDPGIPKQLT